MYDIFTENVKYDGYKLQFGEKIKIEETEDLIRALHLPTILPMMMFPHHCSQKVNEFV